jgi:hypothetical protein
MNNSTKWWFAFMYVMTTFIAPWLGWSDNKIGWPQIVINLLIWTGAYFSVIYYYKIKAARQLKNNRMKK